MPFVTMNMYRFRYVSSHPSRDGGLRGLETRGNTFLLKCTTASTTHTAFGPPPVRGAEPPVPHKGPGTASYHLSPFPRLRPCVAWQGSKEVGDHPEKYSHRSYAASALGM